MAATATTATTKTTARNLDSMSVAKAAEFLIMSPRRFRLLVDQGVITKAWGSGYKCDVILREYLDHLHSYIANREAGTAKPGLDPIAERARKDSEMADRVALANAVTRGEQAPVKLFQSALDDATTIIRERTVSLPDQLAGQLVGRSRADIKATLKTHIDGLLRGLAAHTTKTT